jgi:hypothetical protein
MDLLCGSYVLRGTKRGKGRSLKKCSAGGLHLKRSVSRKKFVACCIVFGVEITARSFAGTGARLDRQNEGTEADHPFLTNVRCRFRKTFSSTSGRFAESCVSDETEGQD